MQPGAEGRRQHETSSRRTSEPHGGGDRCAGLCRGGGHREATTASSDTTRSAIDNAAGRWVTRTTVRPCAARCSDAMTRASVVASRCAVGSSSKRSGARRNSARAIASRCASPTDKPAPRSPSGAERAPGERGDAGVETCSREGVPQLVVGGFGRTEPQVVGDRRGEQMRTLWHPCELLPPGTRVEARQRDAADAHRATVRDDEAEEHAQERRLPAAARPDDCDDLTGLDRERASGRGRLRRDPGTPRRCRRARSGGAKGRARRCGRLVPAPGARAPRRPGRRRSSLRRSRGSSYRPARSGRYASGARTNANSAVCKSRWP